MSSSPIPPLTTRVEEELVELDRFGNEMQRYLGLLVQGFDRIIELMEATHLVPKVSAEIHRAVVVMTHAYLEDFLRTLASRLLPVADEEFLNHVPLAGCAGERGKFSLGKLAQHRGKTVDEVLRASVEEYLERSNFSSASEIVSFLETDLGIQLDPTAKDEDLPIIEKMIQRRHQIVHRADRISSEDGVTQLRVIDKTEVSHWVMTTNNFITGTVRLLLLSQFAHLPTEITSRIPGRRSIAVKPVVESHDHQA
jgi:hypothetical protein